ncbi:MAG: GGDEF domain-containing protein [Spirochaetales bacterium]|nr:GGDEF domain-containing protein [Spirochaetales bacterium]
MRIGMTLSHMEYEYSQRLLQGCRQYVEDTGNDFLVFSTEEPESTESEFAYQEWAISKFFNKSNIDGIVIQTATLSRFIKEENAVKFVRNMDKELPVVSIVTQVPDVPSLVVDSEEAFKNLLRHLIDDHGRKRLLLIGIKSESDDLMKRIRYFREVMEEKNLEFDDDHILYAGYTIESAEEVLEKKYPTKESIDFDGIVCVIDEIAMGAISHMFKLGVDVPEQVTISGFDNTVRSVYCYPSLTTIDQGIPDQSYLGAKLLSERINGKKIDLVTNLHSRACYRVSCGCLTQGDPYVSITDKGDKIPKDRDFYSAAFKSFFVHNNQNVNIMDFIEDLNSGLSLDALSRRLDRYMKMFNIKGSAICLYEKPVEINRHEKFVLPDKARIFYACNVDVPGQKTINSEEYFDCSKSLLPDFMMNDITGLNAVRILYHGNLQYGYMILSIGDYGGTEYMMIYTLMAKFIASAYEVSNLSDRNKKLSILSKTDEMTGILNRRGFMLVGQQNISLASDVGKSGLVIYGDMDGLKYINDTYGHEAGDRAIIAEVELLKKTFRAADTIGRLGGDEFAIVSISLTMEMFEKLRHRLDELCEEWNRTSNEPFKLSISLGAAVFDSEKFNLESLLSKADDEQYKVKHAKKAIRQN